MFLTTSGILSGRYAVGQAADEGPVQATQQDRSELMRNKSIGERDRLLLQRLIESKSYPDISNLQVRMDRWPDREDRGFGGDKPNRTKYLKPGSYSKIDQFWDVKLIEVPSDLVFYAWPRYEFQGELKGPLGPGRHRYFDPRSGVVAANVNWQQDLTEFSDTLVSLASYEKGCAVKSKSDPVVKAYQQWIQKILELGFRGSPFEEPILAKEAETLQRLSANILRDGPKCEAPKKKKQKEVECPEGSFKLPEQVAARLSSQGFPLQEKPQGSGCYVRRATCPPGFMKVENPAIVQSLKSQGIEENPPGSNCFPEEPKKLQGPPPCEPPDGVRKTFGNGERICVRSCWTKEGRCSQGFEPQPHGTELVECAMRGGELRGLINTRTGKIRRDRISCIEPRRPRQARQPVAPPQPPRPAPGRVAPASRQPASPAAIDEARLPGGVLGYKAVAKQVGVGNLLFAY